MTDLSPADTDRLALTVAALLDQALSKLRRDETGARVYPISEAAVRLNMSDRTLEQWCRDGVVVHTKIGRFRGLTAHQIERVIADHETSKGTRSPSAIDDELAAARAASSNAARRTSRRVA